MLTLSGSAARASGHSSSTHLNRQSLPVGLQPRGSSAPGPKLDELMPVKDGAQGLARGSRQQKTEAVTSFVIIIISIVASFIIV